MGKFEDLLINEAQKSVLNLVREGFTVGYSNQYRVPPGFFESVWGMLDQEKVAEAMAERLEEVVAEKVMNLIATEITNDIKKIMSNQDRREEVRAVARENLKRIMTAGNATGESSK